MKPNDAGAKITVIAVDGLGAKTKDGRPIAANWAKAKVDLEIFSLLLIIFQVCPN